MIQSDQKPVEVPGIAYKDKYIIFAILMIGILMSVLDGFMVNIALPDITTYFNVGVSFSQWIITGYLLAMTGLFIFFGKVSDYVGKARLFMAGWAIFGLSSLACGLAPGLNELIAYVEMAKLPPEALSPHSRLIMTYALCGFANLGSLGIMIGAMGAMAPKRRAEITGLGVKSIVSGTMATLMAGAIVGIIL